MVNTEEFTKRLETILDYYSVSASSFADTIGVQRSALSHLMSGRNKPSLDLIMKIIEAYPEVDIYWLLNGKGNFPKDKNNDGNISEPSPASALQEQPADLFSFNENAEASNNMRDDMKSFRIPTPPDDTDIEQIVIFYKDGTFRHYKLQ